MGLRFENVKVGDQLERVEGSDGKNLFKSYWLVTHRWFDPVEGHHDTLKGEMVGVKLINETGETPGRPYRHTIRGLASQRFRYAEIDYLALCAERLEGMTAGRVVGIGKGRVIRARPKVPGL